MTSRRSFLASVAAALVGPTLFKRLHKPKPPAAPETGVSICIIRRWDEHLGYVMRMDVTWGFPAIADQSPHQREGARR